MPLSQSVTALLLVVMVLAFAVGSAVAVHLRPSLQAPLTVAFGAVTVAAAVLGTLVAASR
ncbi:hypothetical protein OG758_48700 [Streptomyces sp. NBC_01474]|uniref:hypothetical protein n=1 Tax=Streptomyces sp. NBC_01474 TaxID=2903880 RepID=UPI002DDBBBD5|nr:hypothetical protein [Streptomyces sp. NBC_01474]WSD92770.1 hypothetical protein OG758_00090 [Streptomyces sp. NBC_01474]WSE01285.1 hypothetical protein OG758_48700 [Streptomyces sp. NBC_01474]